MREIKFRAFVNGEMRVLDELRFPISDYDYPVMQYTGLKDKKRTKEYPEGQEIYEGDVVNVYHMTGVNWDEVDFVEPKVITFHVGMFSFGPNNTVDMCSAIWKCEVIGNIYENPELLEDK